MREMNPWMLCTYHRQCVSPTTNRFSFGSFPGSGARTQCGSARSLFSSPLWNAVGIMGRSSLVLGIKAKRTCEHW